jgi:hypothetical protein
MSIKETGGKMKKRLALCVVLMALGLSATAQQSNLYLEGGLGLSTIKNSFDTMAFDITFGAGIPIGPVYAMLGHVLFSFGQDTATMLYGLGVRYYVFNDLQIGATIGYYHDFLVPPTYDPEVESPPVFGGFGLEAEVAYDFGGYSSGLSILGGIYIHLGFMGVFERIDRSLGFFVKAIWK